MQNETYDRILQGFYDSSFLTDDLLTFIKLRANNERISPELINRLSTQLSKNIIQHEMPFVFCDLLGATAKMKDFDIIDVYHDVYTHLERAKEKIQRFEIESEIISSSGVQVQKDYSKIFGIESFMFSDSIILYPRIVGTDFELFYFNNRDVYQKHVTSAMLVALLDIFCTLTDEGLMLRGVMGYGDVLIQQDSPIYISKIIEEVIWLEKKQEWSGILMAPSILQIIKESGLLDDSWICEYAVPFKEDENAKILDYYNTTSTNPHVLDWRGICTYDEEKLKERAKDSKGKIHESVQNKIQNTTKFYNSKK